VTHGVASADFASSSVSIDSRDVGPGSLFVALRGTATDGHRFVDLAMANGAAGAVVSEHVDRPHVRVGDSMSALEALGHAARARFRGLVIGVTGSVGKTGTKDALAAALAGASKSPVHRSLRSYNNHVGVPLSLARMPRDGDYAVLEMGMNHAREIAALTSMVRPHVAIVTAIGAAHLEHFDSIEGIADAKAEVFQGLLPGGTAIVPQDTAYCDQLKSAASRFAARTLTFGLGAGASIRGTNISFGPGGTKLTVTLPDGELLLTVGQPGAHWVSNALAVIAGVYSAGADLDVAAQSLAELPAMEGRGKRFVLPVVGGRVVVIDESYNANPVSIAATLAVLRSTEATRTVAVLGAMLELGAESDRLHAGLASHVLESQVGIVVLVGAPMAPLFEALRGAVEVVHVADARAALNALKSIIQNGDVILVKGSNAIGLSSVIAGLADSPSPGSEPRE